MRNDISEINLSTKYLPLEYKILEWKLIINRELYENQTIDLNIYSAMEKLLLGRMTKLKNEYIKKEN